MSDQVDIKFANIKLSKNSFILTILIIHIFLLAASLILIIPGIISLILYVQDKNLKHSFHKCFSIYALIMCGIQIVFSFLLSIDFTVSFFANIGNGELGIIFVHLVIIALVIFVILLEILLFINLKTFKAIVESEQNEPKIEERDLENPIIV